MKTNVALVSLRFTPAFVSHLAAFGKAYRELGCDVEFIVHPAYTLFPELASIGAVRPHSDSCLDGSYTHALFVNVSLEHRRFAAELKSRGSKILYVYHEPGGGASLAFLKGEGIRATVKAELAHRLSISMLKIADAVLLASRHGAEAYSRTDIRYNPNTFHVPLLFDDEAQESLFEGCRPRRYFSYIGGICQAHSFDDYVAFMSGSLARGSDLKFLIASRLALPAYVLKDKFIRRNLDRVEIRCGRPLSNDEINGCYAESLCVWNAYRRSTQSGVLPKAFMFGAPVLANRTGSFPEFVKDGFNGKFVSPCDYRNVASAFENIRDNIEQYEKNCRRTFLETFFYRSNLNALAQLL